MLRSASGHPVGITSRAPGIEFDLFLSHTWSVPLRPTQTLSHLPIDPPRSLSRTFSSHAFVPHAILSHAFPPPRARATGQDLAHSIKRELLRLVPTMRCAAACARASTPHADFASNRYMASRFEPRTHRL